MPVSGSRTRGAGEQRESLEAPDNYVLPWPSTSNLWECVGAIAETRPSTGEFLRFPLDFALVQGTFDMLLKAEALAPLHG